MGQGEEAPVRALCRLKGGLRGTLRVRKGGRGLALVGEENASPGSPRPPVLYGGECIIWI